MDNENSAVAVMPTWLSAVGQQEQQLYKDLQRDMVAKEISRDQLLGEAASLKAYGRARARDWVNSALGVSVDPDFIKVTSRFKLDVGQRSLVQEDKRTLGELALFGLHDRYQRAELIFEGQVPSGMSQWLVENWLESVNIRSDYAQTRQTILNSSPVRMAFIEAYAARLAFSLCSANLQRHIGQPGLAMVERFMQGDPSVSASAFQINQYRFGFRDLTVYLQKSNPYGSCVLYAPGSPGGRDWHQFPNTRELEFQVAGWFVSAQGLAYLSAQTRPAERAALTKYAATLRQLPSAWKGATFPEWPVAVGGVFAGWISHQIAWDLAQDNLVHPAAYRSGPYEWRQHYARLNTELRALYTVGTREAGIINYESFCYDLIKRQVEDLLKTFGETVQVNPDKIFIDLSASETLSLTQLVIKEISFYVQERYGEITGAYPRFRPSAEHPALRNLDIRQLASWSRTLRPGEKYIAMLRGDYLNEQHRDYQLRREVHFKTRQAEMYRAVLSSFYAGELARDIAGQLYDLVQGFAKEPASSFPPYGEAASNVQYNAVFKFYVKRCLVEGVYVFRLVQSGKITEILYTPGSPDGINFRPMSQFFASIRENGLGQYFYGRVKYVDQPIMGTFINNVEYTNISESLPELALNSRVLSLRPSYNERIERIISNVDAQTTSLREIISKLVYDAAVLAASAVSLVIPPVGLALSVVQITKNVLDGAEAYRYGDRETAFNNFKDALLDLIDLVPGGKEATQAQKTLIQLIGDSKTIVGLIGSATGQTLGHDRLLELLEDILKEEPAGDSATILL